MRKPIEHRLRSARESRDLLAQLLQAEVNQKFAYIGDALDVEINRLSDMLLQFTDDRRLVELTKREASERSRLCCLERMLQSLADQLAAPDERLTFWRYIRRI